MAYRQEAEGQKCLDLLHRLQLSPTPKNLQETVLQWTKLDISHADIKDSLPESIGRCKNAKHILAGGNRLSSLPQSISNLPHLTVLDLYRNAFTTFPIALCRLTNLEELYLNNNKLSDIPKEIANMKGLKIFMLDHNALTAFPIALCGLTNLEELYLGDNQLSDIPDKIIKLVRLKKFWLYKNEYTKIPIALCGMTNLEELYLDKNQLSDIPTEITGMKGLKIFWLSHNKFKTFPTALCGLTNLEELDLGDNQLSDIPLEATTMEKLQVFGLSFNNITRLPPQMKNMVKLKQLDVVDNPLLQPPIHTAKRGLDAIKRYFEAITDTKAIRSRIQVNFLGETEAGKTSISRTLQLRQSALTKMADRTRVVEQGTWVYDQDIAFNINDFGGHEVYKIGHPIFMSKHTSSLVFITFDLSKYDPENEAHYQLYIGDWIDKVQAQMPGIQIALIGTHLDEAEAQSVETKCSAIKKQLEDHKNKKKRWYKIQKEIVENKIRETSDFKAALHQAYQGKAANLQSLSDQVQPIHEHIFRVSSENMIGIQKLEKYLIDFAKKNAEDLPGMWLDAAKNICTKKQEGSENTLCWEILQKIIMQSAPQSWRECNSHEETKKIMCDILSFLAHRGDIIWFDKNPSLTEVVFHKQDVLENVLKAVLSHDPKAVLQKLQMSMRFTRNKARTLHEDIFTRGIISRQAMSCLCDPFNLSPTEVDAMVELLLKLELCFQVLEQESVPSNPSYYFPCLLRKERQDELDTEWPSKVPTDTNQLTLQVIFPYRCPDGLYEKFSVRQHKHLGLLKTKRIDWRNGMYAEFERCKMLLTQGKDQQNLSPGQDPDWIISIAVRGTHLFNQWRVLKRAHHDLMDIIQQDWPGLPYDKYLVCPHCMSEDNKDSEHQTLPEETPNVPLTTIQDPEEVQVPTKKKRYTQKSPTLFPGEILDQANVSGYGPKQKQVPCVNTGDYIPANLVYPPSWQDAIRKHKTELCENITEPCLLDMLNVFLQKRVITVREAQTVKAEPSTDRVKCPEKIAVFLDILIRKPSKAHVTLCQCLREQEQTDLLELIK